MLLTRFSGTAPTLGPRGERQQEQDGARRFEIADVAYPATLTSVALVPFLHCWQHTAEYLALPCNDAQHLLDRVAALVP